MPTLWEIELQYILHLARMKGYGIKVDREFCEKKAKLCRENLDLILSGLSFNPGSTKDLEEVLINQMNFPVVKTTPAGKPSFDKNAMVEYEELLEANGSDLAKRIIAYRGWQKTLSSNYKAYLELMDGNDVLHPNYKPHGTVTGRSSCEHPNLQQIPRESSKPWNGDLKRAFIPREGYTLWEFDFSQLELRLIAAAARETELLEAFEAGEDVFQVMADSLGWERYKIKTFYYAVSYGAGAERIGKSFGLSVREGQMMIQDFYRRYTKLKALSDKAKRLVKIKGYIEYWTGRRRHFEKGMSDHLALNAWSQGGGFEIVKRTMLRCAKQLPYKQVITVHDSIGFEIPVDHTNKATLEGIRSVMEDNPKEFGVKFAVEYKQWGAKE